MRATHFNQLPQLKPIFNLQRLVIQLLHSQAFAYSSVTNCFFTIRTPSFELGLFNRLLCTNQTFSYSDEKTNLLSSSGEELNQPHEDANSIKSSNIARSVISKCSYLWEKKGEPIEQLCLKDHLLRLSDISPKTTRKFWRVLTLKPEDALEILLGFDFECRKSSIEARKVGGLWKLFKWASEQNESFEHLPQSYKIMASMLVRVQMLSEAELLLRSMEARGILFGGQDIFSKVCEGYAIVGELERSILMYNWMRGRGLVPCESCYQILLSLLIERHKTLSAFRVCMDMIAMGLGLSNENLLTFESVVKLVCKKGKVKEARSVVRKLLASGLEPSCVILNLIANGYCEKKDFDDLLNFLKERKCAPDAPLCNKILSSQCRNFGSEHAYLFMVELENLGFKPDEVTFGIFISWSCREGKVKDAFIYLSEVLARGLKPDKHSYNALISGVFKKGMWKHASEIFHEMLEKGITPDLSTFKVLLAGYCNFKRFDDVKAIISEMVNWHLVQLSPLEDPLSKAFFILGFKPSAVKVKRDNGVVLQKAEFFDPLGNGLYLETDMDKYEKIVMGVLEDAMFPDFNSLILKECNHGNIKTALILKDTIICRGQKLSLSAYSALLNRLCVSRSYFSKAISLYEEMAELVYHLDKDTLNLFIQIISKKGLLHKGKIILERMLRCNLSIENETHTAVIMALCKEGCQKELHKCWGLARNDNWIPSLKDCKIILGCLCKQGMLKEVLELLECMLVPPIHSISDISNIFLEVLCDKGHASIGRIFVCEVIGQRGVLDYTAYNHLISGLCKEKSYQDACVILEAMLEKNMTPCVDVYGQLIPQLCRSNRLEKVMTVKEIMLRKESLSCFSVYYALVNGLCRGGKIREAAFQFQEMIAKGILPDTDTYNVMIQGYCQDNNSRRVGELLSIMVRNNVSLSISSFRNLVRLMCMHGKMSHALSLKEILVKESKPPAVFLYNILIFQFLQMGINSLVTVLLDEMKRKDVILDEVTYNFLIFGSLKCQDVSGSLEIIKTMIDKDLRPSKRSLRVMIRHLCYHGNLNEALELSKVMELRGWVHGEVVQHTIVEGLLSHGRLEEAEKYLKRIQESSLIPNSINYDGLIKIFLQYGIPHMAVDLLDIMLKKGNLPSPSSYDSVIQVFCFCKAVDDALNVLAEMLARDLKPSMSSWDILIFGLCINGRTVESERLLDSIIQLGQIPTQSMYQSVIDRYSLESNHNKASELLHKMQQHGYVPDFKTHWSLISNLSNSNKESTESGGFLSKLLSMSGFTRKKDFKVG